MTTLQRAIGVAGGLQGLNAQRQNMDLNERGMVLNEQQFEQNTQVQQQKQQAQQQQMNLTEKAKQNLMLYQETQDPKHLSAAIMDAPELAKAVVDGMGVDSKLKANQASQFTLVSHEMLDQGNVDGAMDLAGQRLQQLRSQGRPTKDTEAYIQNLTEKDIDKAKGGLKVAASALYGNGMMDKEVFKRINPDKNGADLPAEALAFNDLIKGFAPAQQEQAKLVKAGLKGRAMNNAMTSALQDGNFEEFKNASGEVKQAEKFAEMTGASRAKAIDGGFESIVKIDSGIRNIDKAIRVVQSGAGVGAVEKIWPSIKASSVELDNIRGQMALDVVGATTFGALSEGELNLAKDIALPTGLDTKELEAYLVRKKAAQEKLRNYYNEQIQFIDQGGTVAGFLRQKERDQGDTPSLDVPINSPALGREVTASEIQDLITKTGLSEKAVRQRLGI